MRLKFRFMSWLAAVSSIFVGSNQHNLHRMETFLIKLDRRKNKGLNGISDFPKNAKLDKLHERDEACLK